MHNLNVFYINWSRRDMCTMVLVGGKILGRQSRHQKTAGCVTGKGTPVWSEQKVVGMKFLMSFDSHMIFGMP